MKTQEDKFRDITEAPLYPLLWKMAIPSMIVMIVTAVYSVTDTFFIGKLNRNELTASVGIVFSFISMIGAVKNAIKKKAADHQKIGDSSLFLWYNLFEMKNQPQEYYTPLIFLRSSASFITLYAPLYMPALFAVPIQLHIISRMSLFFCISSIIAQVSAGVVISYVPSPISAARIAPHAS